MIHLQQPTQTKRLSPTVAFVLSLLGWGLGQMYSGRLHLGTWIAALVGLVALVVGLTVLPLGFGGYLVLLSVGVVACVGTAIEAGVYARRSGEVPLRDYMRPRYLVLGLVVVWVVGSIETTVIRSWGAQTFRIPTGAMESTLLVGDYIVVDKRPGYRPQAGDLVVFTYPLNPKLKYVKRCVALGGDTVEIRNGDLFVDGIAVPLPTTAKMTELARHPSGTRERVIYAPSGEPWNRDHFGPICVPDDHLFVLGDNRDNSADSRYWGFLPVAHVRGKAKYVSLSIQRRGGMPLGPVRWSRIGKTLS